MSIWSKTIYLPGSPTLASLTVSSYAKKCWKERVKGITEYVKDDFKVSPLLMFALLPLLFAVHYK